MQFFTLYKWNLYISLLFTDREGAEMLLRDRQIEELKAENEVMKNAVHRINVELSQYQAKYRPLSEEEVCQNSQHLQNLAIYPTV